MRLRSLITLILCCGCWSCNSTLPSQNPNERLFSAAYSGDLSLAREAIRDGADINIRSEFDDSETPLLVSVANNHVDVAELLIQKDAMVEIDHDGGKAVLAYAQGSHKANLRKLLEQAQRVQSRSHSP